MKLTVLAATVALAATAAFAQPPAPRQPDLTAVTQYLGLSTAQIQSLQTIQQQERTALQPLMQQLRTAHQSLRQLENNNGDANAIAAAIANVQNLQKQIQQTRATYVTQSQAVLNAAQTTKLQALQAALDLIPTAHEAMFLNLLTPPQGMGPGMGMGMGMGPGMGGGPMGRGFGRGGR